jgi:threonine/homoserine/homoserine lactone efflux protein
MEIDYKLINQSGKLLLAAVTTDILRPMTILFCLTTLAKTTSHRHGLPVLRSCAQLVHR